MRCAGRDSLPRDEALLLGLMDDRAPVVRAYAAFYLVEGGRHTAAVLARTLADEGRMRCQSGCHIRPCAVWETVRSLYVEAAPLEALRAIAAGGAEPAASRAAALVALRVQLDERGARAFEEALRDLREAP